MKAILERLDRIENKLFDIANHRWLNIGGVAEYTSLSVMKIRKAVQTGELKSSMKSGRHLFKVKWVEQWLNDQSSTPHIFGKWKSVRNFTASKPMTTGLQGN